MISHVGTDSASSTRGMDTDKTVCTKREVQADVSKVATHTQVQSHQHYTQR